MLSEGFFFFHHPDLKCSLNARMIIGTQNQPLKLNFVGIGDTENSK